MSKESLLTMLKNFLILFFSVSTIHGFNHITKKGYHPIERLIWFSLVGVAIYATFVLSRMTLTRYQENPTVISVDRNRFDFNTTFPTATICPEQKVNEELLDAYIANSTAIKNKVGYKRLVMSLLEADYNSFDEIEDYEGISGDEILEIILKFHFKFTPMVTNSASSSSHYKLQQTMTEMGLCYSFNSQLAVYNSPEYWANGTWDLIPEKPLFSINPLDGEVFVSVVNMSSGYKFYLHGPYETVDISSKYIESPNGYFQQIYVSGLTIYISEGATNLRVEQRKCRLYHESNLNHFPVYSYVMCRMECRASLAIKFCGCLPYFYRKTAGEKLCDVQGLHCLSKHKEKLILISNKECSCLSNCDETNYFIEITDIREWFLGSNLQWGLKEFPMMRLKRDVIFGFTDLLVCIGGMAGLFLGCSVLSFIEIFYFFTIRLFWFVVDYLKNVNNFKK